MKKHMVNEEQNHKEENKLLTLLRIERSRRVWRFTAVIIFLLLLLTVFVKVETEKLESSNELPMVTENYIAKIAVEGIILEDSFRLKRIKELKEAKNVKAVILEIDSPGGAMVPGLELMNALKDLAETKPLVIRMKSIATSAGFLISLAGDYVIANEASLTGSIGVLMPLIDATELGNKIGVKSAEVTSGDLKSITSPLAKRSQKAQMFLQDTVDELEQIFMAKVLQRREITTDVKELISDGRFFTGQTALDYKLIDGLGNQTQLMIYLENEKGISKDLEVIDVPLKKKKKYSLREVFADEMANSLIKNLKISLESISLVPQAYTK